MNFIFTGNNAKEEKVDEFVKAMKKGIKVTRKNPGDFSSENASLYGIGVKVPPFIMEDGVKFVVNLLNDLPNS